MFSLFAEPVVECICPLNGRVLEVNEGASNLEMNVTQKETIEIPYSMVW